MSFQSRVDMWVQGVLGLGMRNSHMERAYRLVEESLEAAQAVHMSKADALRLVEYVYSRPKGDPYQEAGGCLIVLAAYCTSLAINMEDAGEVELARCWRKADAIAIKAHSKEIRDEGD